LTNNHNNPLSGAVESQGSLPLDDTRTTEDQIDSLAHFEQMVRVVGLDSIYVQVSLPDVLTASHTGLEDVYDLGFSWWGGTLRELMVYHWLVNHRLQRAEDTRGFLSSLPAHQYFATREDLIQVDWCTATTCCESMFETVLLRDALRVCWSVTDTPLSAT
jgi:hypothetical protein